MGIWKTTLTANYSFKKLADNIEKILGDVFDDLGTVTERTLRGNIDAAKYQPLSPTTKRLRRKGVGWGGKTVPSVTHDIPLRQTDALYNSLKYNKKTKSINMEGYGLKHQKGFVNPKGFYVPARPFIDLRRIHSGIGIKVQETKLSRKIKTHLTRRPRVYYK